MVIVAILFTLLLPVEVIIMFVYMYIRNVFKFTIYSFAKFFTFHWIKFLEAQIIGRPIVVLSIFSYLFMIPVVLIKIAVLMFSKEEISYKENFLEKLWLPKYVR